MDNIYKIIMIVILIVNIYIISNYYYENYSSINYDNLTDEEKKIIEEALKNRQTNVRYLAATDIEAILNVSSIVKNGSIPIPVGSIIAYYSVEVPQGWALCNGQTVNGHKTPDLRNKFVVSTGNKYNLNATGGSEHAVVVSHNHSMNEDGNHNHYFDYAYLREHRDGHQQNLHGSHGGTDHDNEEWFAGRHTHHSGKHTHHINNSGEDGTNKNLPPYFALTYIMKV